jgi:hypothetical protein
MIVPVRLYHFRSGYVKLVQVVRFVQFMSG